MKSKWEQRTINANIRKNCSLTPIVSLERFRNLMLSKIDTESDLNALVEMAYEIWTGHFGSMFDDKTLLELIECVQSKEAILSQLKDGYQYFFINQDNKRIGYIAYKIDKPNDELFLSKIYIYSSQRGKGVGRKVMNYLEKLCIRSGVRRISLTVYHKNTDSIKAYEAWGFTNLGLIKREFANGFVFKDVRMEKSIE